MASSDIVEQVAEKAYEAATSDPTYHGVDRARAHDTITQSLREEGGTHLWEACDKRFEELVEERRASR